ncbi:MAG: hypothetical protein ABR567_19490 [Myxococcales bacterium]|nr:hypothetical protein [Myxococcales bacterium]
MRALLITLLALPALAWEPTSPPAVQTRIAELEKAWSGKSPDEVAQDKAARARQPKPAWADKSTWKIELGPLTYYFAVGKAGFGPAGKPAVAKETSGRAIDWWYDADAGVLYTLVVDAR